MDALGILIARIRRGLQGMMVTSSPLGVEMVVIS